MRAAASSKAAALWIGELSRRTGVNIETIGHYERINMMPQPPRTPSGVGFTGEIESRTLTFIRRARELGSTLDEIRALLALAAEGGHQACIEVRDLAARHLADVRAKIADLKALEGILADAVRRCGERKPADFPLIDALSES